MKRLLVFALAATMFLSGPVASYAVTEITGEKKGAFFRIVVPDVWNGDLVIWNHGFSLSPIGPVSDLGPLAFPVQIPEGYAVAASSYSQIGWALFKTRKDNKKLIEVFVDNFGVPGEILITGASLGGIVTAQAIEKIDEPDANITGAFPFCGAVGGSRNWDGAIDIRLIYDFVCSGVPGAALPGGATGLPAPGFPAFPLSNLQMALAVNACTGILAPPIFRTPAQTANLAQILSATTLPESFLLTDMGFVTFGLSNLIHEKKKLKGKQGVGNANVVYPDAVIDAGITRVAANNGAAGKLSKNFTPKGDVGAIKIVSMHTDGDGLVIVENEGNYRDVVPAANLTTAIVDEAGNSHCGFTEAELVAGWESLRGWVAGGPQPSAASIQGLCGFLVLGGASGPCRIDPAFPLGVMSDRVPLR